MKIITAPRRGGKTTQMLAWVREAPEGEHRVCVCASRTEAMRLRHENPDLESWQFVGPDEPRSGAWNGVLVGRGGIIVLGFDNLDLWLADRLPFVVGAVSLTADDEVPHA